MLIDIHWFISGLDSAAQKNRRVGVLITKVLSFLEGSSVVCATAINWVIVP